MTTKYEITKQTRAGTFNPVLDCQAKSDTVSFSLQIFGINSLKYIAIVKVLISEPGTNKLDMDCRHMTPMLHNLFLLWLWIYSHQLIYSCVHG